ncbi:MAG: MFS transporter [Chloroflexi bacterium]|nr:MFS transporter [Chloroflexota bacterium]
MYEGWKRNLYVVWFATFASLTGGSLVQPFLPLFINRDLGISDPGTAAIWFGLAVSGGGVAQAVMAPIWGILADRHGRKAMLVRAQFAIGAANAMLAAVASPWQLVTLRVVQGTFSGVVGASRALVAGSVPRDKVPYAMGVIQSAIFMGQTLGPTIGGILGSTIGFRASFFTTAAINIVAGTLAYFYVKDIARGDGGGKRAAQKVSLQDLLRSRPLTLLVIVFFLTSVGNMLSRPLLPLLLLEIDPLHDVAFTSGLAFSVLGISGTIASVASSRGTSRIGLRTLVVVSALFSGASTYFVGQASSPEMVLAGLFVGGLAQGTLASSSTALISLFAPASRQGTAFGILTSAQSLAMGAGPLSGGLIANAFGLRTPFATSGVIMLAGVLLVLFVPAPPTFTDSEADAEAVSS